AVHLPDSRSRGRAQHRLFDARAIRRVDEDFLAADLLARLGPSADHTLGELVGSVPLDLDADLHVVIVAHGKGHLLALDRWTAQVAIAQVRNTRQEDQDDPDE